MSIQVIISLGVTIAGFLITVITLFVNFTAKFARLEQRMSINEQRDDEHRDYASKRFINLDDKMSKNDIKTEVLSSQIGEIREVIKINYEDLKKETKISYDELKKESKTTFYELEKEANAQAQTIARLDTAVTNIQATLEKIDGKLDRLTQTNRS